MSRYLTEPIDELPFASAAKSRRYATERYVGAVGRNWYRCDPSLQFLMRRHLGFALACCGLLLLDAGRALAVDTTDLNSTTPQQLAQITEQVYNYIKSNPGQGVEQIAKALATSTKELTLPIRKLLTDKKISSKGQKRATRYSPR